MRAATAVLVLLLGAPSPSDGQEAADPSCCKTIATADELYAAFAATTDGIVNVCASDAPIVWDETATLDSLGKIYLNDNAVNPSVSSFKLTCVAADEYDEKRCVVDFAPTASYDDATVYGGFVLQNQRQLVVDGFEFQNYRGQGGQIFYNQKGSTLTIRNSVFADNGSNAPSGKNPVIVYDFDHTAYGFVTTIIENSLFTRNQGTLLGFQAGNAILKNNVFYDNTLPPNYESLFSNTAFINWKAFGTAGSYTDNTIKIEGNSFVSFQAPASSGAHDKFWMIAAGGPSTETAATTANMFANVTASNNCASNNDVAGEYLTVNIPKCNSGVYGAGPWPDRVCLPFTGTCPAYSASILPQKPLVQSFCASTRRYFLLEDDFKALDFDTDSSATLIDITSPAAGLAIFEGPEDEPRTVPAPAVTYTGTSPLFYPNSDSNCQPPTSDEDPDAIYPGQGCTCFLPGDDEVSYFDMADQSDTANRVTGYETAFDTSVSGGVSVAGWFKAADTGDSRFPGQQTSLIFTRGEKASWKHGYTFGLDKWKGWRFQVILEDAITERQYALQASSPVNAYPGVDQWTYVVGIYDADKGRICVYVNNELAQCNYTPISFLDKNIRWDAAAGELALSRIGNGYDANSKNFHGCLGGFQVYGKALQVSTTASPTASPTKNPTESPTKNPTESPTKNPTGSPTKSPTASPTMNPTGSPTKGPTEPPMIAGSTYDFGALGPVGDMAVVHYVDQTKTGTHCGFKNNKPITSCWETLTPVEINVCDRADLPPEFHKKDADVFFDYEKCHPLSGSAIPLGSGNYVALAKYQDTQSGKDIYASKYFNQYSVELQIKFMMHIDKHGGVKWFGADVKKPFGNNGNGRKLQSNAFCEDLTIVHPQYSVWDNATEIYPMDIITNSSCDLDICALIPPGYELVAALDEDDMDLPLFGDCVHAMSSGGNVILLFQLAASDASSDPDVAFEMEVLQRRNLRNQRNLKKKARIEIGGYTLATKKKAQAALREKLKEAKKGNNKAGLFS